MNHRPARMLTVLSAILLLLGVISIPASAQDMDHYCEAFDGVVLVQTGTATCSAGAVGDKSYALATGPYSRAAANTGGTAIADGFRAYAGAHGGEAFAEGRDVRAYAIDPGSIARVHGAKSEASAVNGGVAVAAGTKAYAHAGPGGEAFADGDQSSSIAYSNCYSYAGPNQTDSCP